MGGNIVSMLLASAAIAAWNRTLYRWQRLILRTLIAAEQQISQRFAPSPTPGKGDSIVLPGSMIPLNNLCRA
jgi:hypothetical protein